jgi:DNA-directed RNA polymerase specialized sigma subunit
VKKLLKYLRLVIRMAMASSTRKNSKFTTSRSVKTSRTTTRQESLRKELTKRLLLRLKSLKPLLSRLKQSRKKEKNCWIKKLTMWELFSTLKCSKSGNHLILIDTETISLSFCILTRRRRTA